MRDLPIGVFDSGVGGISVLREMAALYPAEDFIYYGDSGNAPYGYRNQAEIARLTLRSVDFLMEMGIKALVIACNTATSACATRLRQTLSIPVVGMEPALKPAHAMRGGGQVLVLATPATLRQEKFRLLMRRYGEGAEPVPLTGVVESVERGELSGEGIERVLREQLEGYLAVPTDVVVLGCTHYVFLKPLIERICGDIPVIDGNRGTALQLGRLLAENGLMREGGRGGVRFFTTGDAEVMMPLMEGLFSGQRYGGNALNDAF